MFFEFDFDAMLTDRLEEVAEFSPSEAEALEFGATTVIGIMSNAASTLTDLTPEQDKAITDLFEAAQPSVDRLRDATLAAQVEGVEVEDEETEVEDEEAAAEAAAVSAIDDLVEGLFAMMIGADAAAEVRAKVEANREPVETEVEEEEDDTLPEDEFDKFLADLLSGRIS